MQKFKWPMPLARSLSRSRASGKRNIKLLAERVPFFKSVDRKRTSEVESLPDTRSREVDLSEGKRKSPASGTPRFE